MEITNRTYSEIYAILNLLSFDEFLKIPDSVWNNIESKRDTEVDIEISNINNYVPSNEANYLLASLYKKYFATPEEREIIKAKERSIYITKQNEAREKYNPDNIFKNKKQEEITEKVATDNVAMTEYKESVFKKFINKIKQIFKIS